MEQCNYPFQKEREQALLKYALFLCFGTKKSLDIWVITFEQLTPRIKSIQGLHELWIKYVGGIKERRSCSLPLAKLWTWERTTVLAQCISVQMQCSYHREATSVPPPVAAQIKAVKCVLEYFFFRLYRKNISSVSRMIEERIVGTKNKDKGSEKKN